MSTRHESSGKIAKSVLICYEIIDQAGAKVGMVGIDLIWVCPWAYKGEFMDFLILWTHWTWGRITATARSGLSPVVADVLGADGEDASFDMLPEQVALGIDSNLGDLPTSKVGRGRRRYHGII